MTIPAGASVYAPIEQLTAGMPFINRVSPAEPWCGNSAFILAQMTIVNSTRIMGGGRGRRAAGKYLFVIRRTCAPSPRMRQAFEWDYPEGVHQRADETTFTDVYGAAMLAR